MNRIRSNSSPDVAPATATTSEQQYDDSALEGVAAHIKLLLKLIQDHKDACDNEKNDKRRMLRVATMMTILDNVRGRIQKCQSFGSKKSEAELRRCNSDLKPIHLPRDRKHIGGGGGGGEPPTDQDKEKMRRELSASLAARKSLEMMCSSLGKEKEIMASELSRKVHELNEMEDLINDLKEQNETLLEKLQELDHKEKESHGNAALQDRNKALSEQLLRSLDGYRSMKRKLRQAEEENDTMRVTMDEMGTKVVTSLERVQSFKERLLSGGSDPSVDVQEEIMKLENMFKGLQIMVAKHQKQ